MLVAILGMATATIPLLSLRHNGPRGVGAASVKALRRFTDAPPDLVLQELGKVKKEKAALVAGLRNGARILQRFAGASPEPSNALAGLEMDGAVGVRAKLQKIKDVDKRIKVHSALFG